ncbi:MAG: c-type cytochrome [Rhodocyclales bacterium]|nr:c-type cytochrome [Rhodocyclales bacterium]
MKPIQLVAGVSLVVTGLALPLPSFGVDEDAARKLMKANDCTKCHAPAKTKKGPSLKKIAAENRDKADAEAILIKHMTAGAKVKLDDGTEEEHKVIDTKDQAALKNLAQWILSQ